MVDKAKSPKHKFKSSLIELEEVINHFIDKEIYVKKSMKSILKILEKEIIAFICIQETYILLMIYLRTYYYIQYISKLESKD